MSKERFILQPSRKPGFWVATDTEHGIVITFREHEFNDTQKVTLLGGDTFDSDEEAMKVATYLREIADWLAKEHYNVAMPSVVIQRKTMGASIRSLRMHRGLTQEELAQKAGITRANLASIEAGKYSAGLDVLNKIANAMGVKVEIM
mgnify:FL=1